ncbi:MAG: electron transfer flavoprotein subunit alpha/FixB family protein [Chloroflexi bacterium]|nr:electron transfer flavoprotein subunit alpha/FixB family protein [Chloroflexota bacterium]
MAGEKGILIGGELPSSGGRPGMTLELLSIGRKLADELNEELSVLLLGNGVNDAEGQELIAHGADKVYIINDPLLATYHPDTFATATEKALREIKPNIFLMGRSEIGQDVAPMVGFRLRTGVAMDCLDLQIDAASKKLMMIRPVYGGNARAHFVCTDVAPQMATVRPKTQDPAPRQEGRIGTVQHLSAALDASVKRSEWVAYNKWESAGGVTLPNAEIVISGGRGIGSAEAYKDTIEVCAGVVGGAAGASKACCDAGYAPPGLQVGLTGQRVSPKLYVAVAISGASQHIAGMGTSKNIVAINKDPDANIFKVSRYGIVADYKQVMPAFIKKCRELVGKSE